MARSAGVGTILLRNFALGASTPWISVIRSLIDKESYWFHKIELATDLITPGWSDRTRPIGFTIRPITPIPSSPVFDYIKSRWL